MALRTIKKEKPFKIIFFYSIGRSGTAYLYQVFGHKKWKPLDTAYPNEKTAVVHEKWGMKKKDIEKLKLLKPTSEEGLKIQEDKIKIMKNTAYWNGYETILITDSCFGRWCPYYIIKNCDYRAILLDRKRDDIINSWKNRYRAYAKKNNKRKSRELITQRFAFNYFNITDKYTLLHVDKEKWKKYSLGQKIGWYYDEAMLKWDILKKEMDEKKVFETSYEKITTIPGLKELSDFIELPFNYDLMKVKVNYNEYD